MTENAQILSKATARLGLGQALLAFLLWGMLPLYFKMLSAVPAVEVVAFRAIFSVPILFIILVFRKNISGLLAILRNPKQCLFLLCTAILIAINWLFYVWAVGQNHILAASLGYFISPLLSVFLGVVVLKERISRNQWLAIALAAIGVAILAFEAWQTLWISLILAGSWSVYSLLRRMTNIGPVVGLTMETMILTPFFIAYIFWIYASFSAQNDGIYEAVHFGDNMRINLLMIGASVMTATPLLLFTSAAQKMSFTLLGIIQYIAPSLQFIIGVVIFKEVLTLSHIICFACIWISLALYSAETYLGSAARQAKAAA